MNEAPDTFGELRRDLAQVMHDMRYGHLDVPRGLAVGKIAAQIANLMNAEIEACRFLSELGQNTQVLGGTPINRIKIKPVSTLPAPVEKDS